MVCKDERRFFVYGITHFEQRQPQTKLPTHPHKKNPHAPQQLPRNLPHHPTPPPHNPQTTHPGAPRPRPPKRARATRSRPHTRCPLPAARRPPPDPRARHKKRGRPSNHKYATVSAVPDAHPGAALAATRPPAAASPPRRGAGRAGDTRTTVRPVDLDRLCEPSHRCAAAGDGGGPQPAGARQASGPSRRHSTFCRPEHSCVGPIQHVYCVAATLPDLPYGGHGRDGFKRPRCSHVNVVAARPSATHTTVRPRRLPPLLP